MYSLVAKKLCVLSCVSNSTGEIETFDNIPVDNGVPCSYDETNNICVDGKCIVSIEYIQTFFQSHYEREKSKFYCNDAIFLFSFSKLVVTEKWIPLQKKMSAEFVMAMVHSVKQLVEDFRRNLLQVRETERQLTDKKRSNSYL